MKVTWKHAQGVPSWAELRTTDEVGALAFYSGLFGWTDNPQPMPQVGTYHSQRLDGDDIVGLALQDQAERDQGVPPHWTVYIAVDNAAQAAGRVAAAGGTVIVPAFNMGDHGAMAVIADPTGAVIALAQSDEGFTRIREPGTFTWAELMTDDPDRAATFYRAVLDVPIQPLDVPPGAPPYTLLGPAQAEGAGIFAKGPDMAHVPNSWGVYFEVADTDEAVAKARALGGAVVREPLDIMPGRFAVLADPQGAVFSVIKSVPMPST